MLHLMGLLEATLEGNVAMFPIPDVLLLEQKNSSSLVRPSSNEAREHQLYIDKYMGFLYVLIFDVQAYFKIQPINLANTRNY